MVNILKSNANNQQDRTDWEKTLNKDTTLGLILSILQKQNLKYTTTIFFGYKINRNHY
jgi:hypothetical protein